MSWVLPAIAFLMGTLQHFHHQTLAVADESYPVTPPPERVTIVTPAYNEALWIELTLICLQSQNIVLSYPDAFEFIVVDNESEDETAYIASKYATVVSAPRGYVNALTKGFEAANSDIVAFVDADSVPKSNYLNLLLSNFNRPEVVAVSGNIHWTQWDNVITAVASVYDSYLNEVLGTKAFYGGANAIRKDAWTAVGGYDLTIDQQDRQACHQETEVDFWRRLRAIGKVVYDGRATLFVEPRIQVCQRIDCQNEHHPYCAYCAEEKSRQRF